MAAKSKASSNNDKPAKKPAAKIGKKRFKKVKLPRPLAAFFGYFTGAWYEIRQVRWPSRAATWKSTFAVLMFTAFWAVIILLLDLMFQSLLNNILA